MKGDKKRTLKLAVFLLQIFKALICRVLQAVFLKSAKVPMTSCRLIHLKTIQPLLYRDQTIRRSAFDENV
jgi:hypothetical protein